MANLQEMKFTDADGNEMSLWLEATDSDGSERTRGGTRSGEAQRAIQQLETLQQTIKTFASYTLNSFRQISNANIDKVTLEFGINVGGEAGIPYITKGSIGSNVKITVECSFPH